MMQKITIRATKKLDGNQRAIGKLMVLFNKSAKTIQRWIEDKDVRLTTPQALDIISEETGLKDSEILEKGKVAA